MAAASKKKIILDLYWDKNDLIVVTADGEKTRYTNCHVTNVGFLGESELSSAKNPIKIKAKHVKTKIKYRNHWGLKSKGKE